MIPISKPKGKPKRSAGKSKKKSGRSRKFWANNEGVPRGERVGPQSIPPKRREAEIQGCCKLRGDSNVTANHCAVAVVRRRWRLLRILEMGKSRRHGNRRIGAHHHASRVPIRRPADIRKSNHTISRAEELESVRRSYEKRRAIRSPCNVERSL